VPLWCFRVTPVWRCYRRVSPPQSKTRVPAAARAAPPLGQRWEKIRARQRRMLSASLTWGWCIYLTETGGNPQVVLGNSKPAHPRCHHEPGFCLDLFCRRTAVRNLHGRAASEGRGQVLSLQRVEPALRGFQSLVWGMRRRARGLAGILRAVQRSALRVLLVDARADFRKTFSVDISRVNAFVLYRAFP